MFYQCYFDNHTHPGISKQLSQHGMSINILQWRPFLNWQAVSLMES